MFGPTFAATLGGYALSPAWPTHTAGNDENGAHISASSSASGFQQPWNAHDGSTGTQWYAATLGGGSWIQVRFDSYRRASHYSVTGSSAETMAVTFNLLGSNDGVAWTTLDSGVTVISGSPLTNKAISADAPFLYYRILFTNALLGGDLHTAALAEWSFTFLPY